jgi:lysozyme
MEAEPGMTRAQLFDAIRPFAPDRRFLDSHVQVIDALADAFGLPREGDEALGVALGLIKEFEGCKLEAYPDPATGGDPWTIGWGSTGQGIARGLRWTQAQADMRLSHDVAKFMSGVIAAAPKGTANQIGAMTSLAYNIGLQAFRDSTLLRLHNAGDYVGAAAQFARWNKGSGKVMPGLVRRRAAEAEVYLK